MKQTIYQVIEIKTGEILGYLVGKTCDPQGQRYLVVQTKGTGANQLLPINPKTETKYRVDVLVQSA